MPESILGYNNLVYSDDPTVTSTADAGYPGTNLRSWSLAEQYRRTVAAAAFVVAEFDFGSLRTVDSIGVAGHNLPIGSIIQPQYFTTSWQDYFTYTTVRDGQTIFRRTTARTQERFRLVVTPPTGLVASIGNVYLGQSLDLPEGGPDAGLVIPPFGLMGKVQNNINQRGDLLGRRLTREYSMTQFSIANVEPDWVRDYWLDFKRHARILPFYWQWDNSTAQAQKEDAAFCYTTKLLDATAYDESELFMPIGLSAEAVV